MGGCMYSQMASTKPCTVWRGQGVPLCSRRQCLAATWNTTLVHSIGVVVAKEALAKHWQGHSNALSFFAPNINIVRGTSPSAPVRLKSLTVGAAVGSDQLDAVE